MRVLALLASLSLVAASSSSSSSSLVYQVNHGLLRDVPQSQPSTPAPKALLCGPTCLMYCPGGNILDSNGCPTCHCNQAPTLPVLPTTLPDTTSAPATTSAPKLCGPTCLMYCPDGNILDSNGCPTCHCNPAPTLPPVPSTTALPDTSAPATTPVPKLCGPTCMMYCPTGNVLDGNGCPTCHCNPTPTLPALPSTTSAPALTATPAPKAMQLCGPTCMMYCPNGNVLDNNGCPICQCNPAPALPALPSTTSAPATTSTPTITPTPTPAPKLCGPMCMMYCPDGYVLDNNGCPTCHCNPAPSSITPTTTPRATPFPTPVPVFVQSQPICGPICMMYCPNGMVKDTRGCPTCQCNPTSSLSISTPSRSFGTLPGAYSSGISYPVGFSSISGYPATPLSSSSMATASSTTNTYSSLSAAINSAITARFGPGVQIGAPILSGTTVGSPVSGLPAGANNWGPSSLIPGAFISGIKYGN